MKVKQMKTKQLRISKRKLKLFLGMEIALLILFSVIFFYIGKKQGEKKEPPNIQQVSAEENKIHNPNESYGAEANTLETEESDTEESETEESETSESDADTINKDILLVNRDNRLPEDYKVKLLTLPDGVNRAAEEAYEPLCNMLAAGRKEGLAFEICSSYRDVERQQELFDEDVDALMRQGYTYRDAYDEVAKETMPPGCSEHSTGLAFDIVSLGYQMLDDGQEKTAENKWLQEHCAEYGFILRYPKGKEDITAINYESWHYRYVGVEVAEYIMENGITLEEYLEL